jgi:outer membrane protein, heavy metal efflux system
VRAAIAALIVGSVAGGCATISKEKGHREVSQLLEERSGWKTGWEKGSPADVDLQQHVEKLLGSGLTTSSVVQIALLNSPALQETYEELGVSQADMLQAGLLRNPTLGASVGFPALDGRVEYEASIVGAFLELLVLPLRKRVAESQFMVETVRVAHAALQTAAESRKAFVRVQADVQRVELNRTVVTAAQAAADLATQQRAAGNITQLTLAREQATYQQARLGLAKAEQELFEHREELNRLLGLWGPRVDWTLAELLPELPPPDATPEQLEATAIRQRLDVDAARKQALLMANAVSVARSSRVLGLVSVGVHVHQDPDGPRLFGPTLELELPVFDQRQAEIGRLEAQQRQAERRLFAVSVNVRSEVRVAYAQMRLARERVEHYRQVLLPLRQEVVAQSQLQYNGMQLGLYELLEAKREQVETYGAYIEALEGFWSARAELERAMGARLGAPPRQEGVR